MSSNVPLNIQKPTMSAETPKEKPEAAQLSEEKLIQAERREREWKAKEKADTIIRSLIEIEINPDDFVELIKDINQCHYDVIVEERFRSQLCGYPLCDNVLDDIPPERTKVYDITELEMFCSTNCSEASEYIKSQMFTTPLWSRDQDVIPEFKLLDNK